MKRYINFAKKPIKAKGYAKRLVLLSLCAVMLFTAFMPTQVMAFGPFDRPPQPSVLKSSEVDTAKEQAIVDTQTHNSPAPGKSKPDRTPQRELTQNVLLPRRRISTKTVRKHSNFRPSSVIIKRMESGNRSIIRLRQLNRQSRKLTSSRA